MKSYSISDNSIHFQVFGTGPPIALFHPSPNSSSMMIGLAEELAQSYTVICPDTPGYGRSAKLTLDEPTMADFAAAFKVFFESLGIKKLAIYGSATGAQIAIRYGIEYPDEVEHLFLDNCAHFTEEERTNILKEYFPDLNPDKNGDHLVRLWEMVSGLFQYFPWCFKDEEHKLSSPMPPPSILHQIVMDYLVAGGDYDIAYRAAFDHEKVEYLQTLTRPATIFRWQGSILKKYTNRLFDYDLPKNIFSQPISADRALRNQEMVNYIEQTYKSDKSFNFTSGENQLSVDTIEERTLVEEPPRPTEDGLYLIKAWHQLRDIQLLSDGPAIARNEINPIELQKQLYTWYQLNK